MRALIMAGGAGTRLARGEKPLILIGGIPMIRYITDAFLEAGCEPVVAVSQRTPMTANWCRANGIALVHTRGDGYIPDMVQAVRQLDENGPIIVSVSDIPCITGTVVKTIVGMYTNCRKPALSTWVPASRVQSCRGGMPYREIIDGVESCPAGINIVCADTIGMEQEEFAFLFDEPRLALNINTPADLTRAESVLCNPPGS